MDDLQIAYWELGAGYKSSLGEILIAMDQAKYVHASYEDRNIILIFAKHLIHYDIANTKLRGMKVHSAGFIMTLGDLDELTVYGESTSLNVPCNKELNKPLKAWLVANHK